MSKHTWFNCELCGPAVRCGSCNNNCCNGGEFCPECKDAYEIQHARIGLKEFLEKNSD